MIAEPTVEAALVGALLDDLEALDPGARSMFGGYCIYAAQTPVAIVHGGRAYLWIPQADRATGRGDGGSRPFTSPRGQTLHAYHEIPAQPLTDRDTRTAVRRSPQRWPTPRDACPLVFVDHDRAAGRSSVRRRRPT